MLKELRLEQGLTREELASRIRKTPNYILKAEQLTYPDPPPALLNYYAKTNLSGHTLETLKSYYYQSQHQRRIDNIQNNKPNQNQTATDYALSETLCVPASHIHYFRKTGKLSKYLIKVINELLDEPELIGNPFVERLETCLTYPPQPQPQPQQ